MPESRIKRRIIISWQIFEWLVAYIPLRTLWRFEKQYPNHSDIERRPLLIVSNHKHVFDPWFITLSLPFSQFKKILPIRFLATRNFRNPLLNLVYWIIIYPFMYWPNGVYILPPRGKDENLSIADKTKEVREAMRRGEALLFFAEGGVNHKDGIGEFKRGPAYIQKETGAAILPLSIRFRGPWWLPWPFGRRYLRWGSIIHIPANLIADDIKSAVWLREQVLMLYEKI